MAYDLFISHATEDRKVADAICGRLESRSIRCWIAPRDIEPGRSYGAAIVEAISRCEAMTVVLSSNANTSRYVIKEVERGIAKGLPVIPFRIEDVVPCEDLEFFLSSDHWLDAMRPPLEDHIKKLGDTVESLLKVIKPSPPVADDDIENLVKQFNEIAPDEWGRGSKRTMLSWFRSFFDEHL